MIKFVYADNSATTQISQSVIDEMQPFLHEKYANPSSLYSAGRNAKRAIELSRERIAKNIGAKAEEIFFTSGGTESNVWAVEGIAFAQLKKGKNHIITSNIEHHCVLNTIEFLQKQFDFEITYLKVDKNGLVNPSDLETAITEKTALVSIIYANNEIGSIQYIDKLGEICKKHKVPFHTDAVQAIGNVKIDVNEQNIDLLALSAHKFHGPKGVGALYVRKGTRILSLMHGGGQERGKRAGTENTAGIVGMAKAMDEACLDIDNKAKKISYLRDKLIKELLKIEKSRVNGDLKRRLPGNVNVCFEGVEGESLILRLDMEGICSSSGSACTSGALEPSHVLLAIGLPHEVAHGSLRLTLSEYNTEDEIDYIIQKIPKIVEYLRSISPFWEKIKKGEA